MTVVVYGGYWPKNGPNLILMGETMSNGDAHALLREGLHLCVYGERAPGGDETWGEWASKTERLLRSADDGPALVDITEDERGAIRDAVALLGTVSLSAHRRVNVAEVAVLRHRLTRFLDGTRG